VKPLAVSISAESAEIAFSAGRYQEAIEAWTIALDRARESGLKEEGMSAILRRRAAVYVADRQMERAKADFDEAHQMLESAGANEAADFVLIDQAQLLSRVNQWDETERIVARLETKLAGKEVSPHLLAEILVLRAKIARARGNAPEALDYALRSRQAALEAVAPVTYFAASVEVAESHQAQNDFTDAYGTLTTAWATLSDVLGRDTARSWVEPCLLACQIRWGEEVFEKAKNEYEARRRELKRHAPR
jgi:tetratricopeptide (TPR) repeat protein